MRPMVSGYFGRPGRAGYVRGSMCHESHLAVSFYSQGWVGFGVDEVTRNFQFPLADTPQPIPPKPDVACRARQDSRGCYFFPCSSSTTALVAPAPIPGSTQYYDKFALLFHRLSRINHYHYFTMLTMSLYQFLIRELLQSRYVISLLHQNFAKHNENVIPSNPHLMITSRLRLIISRRTHGHTMS